MDTPTIVGNTGEFTQNIVGSTGEFTPTIVGSTGEFTPTIVGSTGEFTPTIAGSTGELTPNLVGSTGDYTRTIVGISSACASIVGITCAYTPSLDVKMDVGSLVTPLGIGNDPPLASVGTPFFRFDSTPLAGTH